MYGGLKKRSGSFMTMGVKSILDAAMLAALSDGDASDDEIWGAVEMLREYGGPFAKLSDNDFEAAVMESFERIEGYGELEDQIAAVAGKLASNEEHATTAYAVAYSVLLIDEDYGDEEDEFLNAFGEALGLDDDTIQEICDEVDAAYEGEEEEEEEEQAPEVRRPAPNAVARPAARPPLREKKASVLEDAPSVLAGVAVGAAGALGVAAVRSKPAAEAKPAAARPVADRPAGEVRPVAARPAAPLAPAAPPPEPPFAFSGSTPVDEALREFKPDDYTVKLCNALFGVLPVEVKQERFDSLAQAMDVFAPGAKNDARRKAQELATSEGVATGLKVVNAIDMGDTGIAAFSGLKSVFGLLTGQGTNALETDAQQGVDAVLKLLALAYFVHSVYPGELTDKVKLFYGTPSGKALLVYYAAVEVGMPFADNALVAGGSFVSDLFGKYGPSAAEKLGGLLPAGGVAAAQGMMGSLMAPIEGVVQKVSPHARTAATAVSGFLPTAMSVLDKAAGAAATAIDAMPVYRYLGARVLAEVCVLSGAGTLKPAELPQATPAPSLLSSASAALSSAAPALAGAAALGVGAVGAVAAARAIGGDESRPAVLVPASTPPFTGATPVDAALREFGPDDCTVKLCNALFSAIPGTPTQIPFLTLNQAFDALYASGLAPVRARAEALASGEAVATGLKVVSAIDTADTGIAAFSGMKSLVGLATGQGVNALETDAQQGVDAVLKLLGLAYLIHSVYPGSVQEKMQLFYTTPTGQALLIYYAAVEVGMPFADNVLVAGGSFVSDLFGKYGPSAAEKLGGLLPAGGVAAAQGMMGSLLAPVDNLVQRVSPYAKTAATAVSGFLPTAMNVLDKAAGAAATAIDAMPVYRYLGARVLAESCVLLASRGLLTDPGVSDSSGGEPGGGGSDLRNAELLCKQPPPHVEKRPGCPADSFAFVGANVTSYVGPVLPGSSCLVTFDFVSERMQNLKISWDKGEANPKISF
jgi:tellurite resistance protein